MTHIFQKDRSEFATSSRSVLPLISPQELLRELPVSDAAAAFVAESRAQIKRVVAGDDDRLLVVVGPCSIHDPVAALEYARWLAPLRRAFARTLCIVMRVYVEKPRTSLGWKGLINDPLLDGSYRINDGLRIARKLTLDVAALEVPVATEFVDVTTPAYLEDVVCWTAIGARTVESQAHREMASGLPFAVGFKNGTTGNVEAAVNAIVAAAAAHRYIAPASNGLSSIISTSGNTFGHVVLRGGEHVNYDAASVQAASDLLARRGFAPHIMVDCGHGNSANGAEGSLASAHDVAEQIARGSNGIMGLMIESNLVEGRQHFPSTALVYGQSITDPCINLSDTQRVFQQLSLAQQSRAAHAPGELMVTAGAASA